VEIFVNKQHCGRAIRNAGTFSFGFQPEPLAEGFIFSRFETARAACSRLGWSKS